MLQNKYTKLTKIGLYISYLFIALFFLGPVLWVLSLSFKTVPELFYVPPKLFPETISLYNYSFILVKADIFAYLINSTKIVGGTILGTLLLAIPAAFAFSRLNFKGKHFSQFALLVFQMISPLVIAIPLYKYFSRMGLLNNYWSMTLVYIVLSLPFATWSLKGYMDTIPISLDEAGTIDGCSRMQVLTWLLLPVIMPGILSVLILVFVRSWAQFIIPFILLSDSRKFPISVGLVNLQSTSDAITTHYLAAACIIGIIPTIIIFIILQRYIVSALTAGALKG
ncbi:ABC transporter permease [Spirochaetia bacterium]|nr:ABC transporter permease [Spirochaetia bacterium]